MLINLHRGGRIGVPQHHLRVLNRHARFFHQSGHTMPDVMQRDLWQSRLIAKFPEQAVQIVWLNRRSVACLEDQAVIIATAGISS